MSSENAAGLGHLGRSGHRGRQRPDRRAGPRMRLTTTAAAPVVCARPSPRGPPDAPGPEVPASLPPALCADSALQCRPRRRRPCLRRRRAACAPHALPPARHRSPGVSRSCRRDATARRPRRGAPAAAGHDPLAGLLPSVRFEIDASRQGGEPGYYVRTCFGVWIGDGPDASNLVDGGFTDWGATLLGDHKERLLTSAIGLERLAAIYLQHESP
jgi:hypothetical protein